MGLTTPDIQIPMDRWDPENAERALRDAAARAAEKRAADTDLEPYYRAKEQLYRNLSDLSSQGELRASILSGIAIEARQVISCDTPREQTLVAVARLEIVIELRDSGIHNAVPESPGKSRS